eukprot:scaffold120456_cov20-Tisochrysis_lutea.AAC.2
MSEWKANRPQLVLAPGQFWAVFTQSINAVHPFFHPYSPGVCEDSRNLPCWAYILFILDSLEEARRDASCAYAARDKARAELEVVVESRAAQDVDLMRMRHEYETDEILVVRVCALGIRRCGLD